MPATLPTLSLHGLSVAESRATAQAESELFGSEFASLGRPGDDAEDFADVLSLIVVPPDQPGTVVNPESAGEAGDAPDTDQLVDVEALPLRTSTGPGKDNSHVVAQDTSHHVFAVVPSSGHVPGDSQSVRQVPPTTGENGQLATDVGTGPERPGAGLQDRANADQETFAARPPEPETKLEDSEGQRKLVATDDGDAAVKVAAVELAGDPIHGVDAPQTRPLRSEVVSVRANGLTSLPPQPSVVAQSGGPQPDVETPLSSSVRTPARFTDAGAGATFPQQFFAAETADHREASSQPVLGIPRTPATPAVSRGDAAAHRGDEAVMTEPKTPAASSVTTAPPDLIGKDIIDQDIGKPPSAHVPVVSRTGQGTATPARGSDSAGTSPPPWRISGHHVTAWQAPAQQLKSAQTPGVVPGTTPEGEDPYVDPQTAVPAGPVVGQEPSAFVSEGEFAGEGKLPPGDGHEAAPSVARLRSDAGPAVTSAPPSSEFGPRDERLPHRDVEPPTQSSQRHAVTTNHIPLTEAMETSTSRPSTTAPSPEALVGKEFEVSASDDLPPTSRAGQLEDHAEYDLTLDSPELGKLWLFVRGTRGEVEARIETATDEAFRMIRNEMGPLHRALQDAGFQGADLSLGRRDPDQRDGWEPPPPPRHATQAGPALGEGTIRPARFVAEPAWQGHVNLLA